MERAKKRKMKRDSDINESRINASMTRAINRLKISKR